MSEPRTDEQRLDFVAQGGRDLRGGGDRDHAGSRLRERVEGEIRIAAAEVKWGKGTKAYRDTKSIVATDLSEETTALLHSTAVAAYQALELRDYGRVDMRLRPDGTVAVIEVNPNPWLASRAELAQAARKAGRTYNQLVEEIVGLAMARYSRSHS